MTCKLFIQKYLRGKPGLPWDFNHYGLQISLIFFIKTCRIKFQKAAGNNLTRLLILYTPESKTKERKVLT